ncbi:MAG: four helix bundle protein [Desulfuromonadales bacterium]|nr:four helix bundle protein [Desulfuromonadales bacterium]
MKDHKELDVWKKSMDFVQAVYELTGAFPKEEIYGLTSQLRRSVVSIPSNIAEGAARNTDKEFLYFLHIAQGSAAEAETQLLIAQRLKFTDNFEAVLSELRTVQKLLHGLMRHYKTKGLKADV